MIFKRNGDTFQYDFVHEHVDVAANLVATNGRWFAVHGDGETVLFELDGMFSEVNKASTFHGANFIHFQQDDSLIAVVSNSINTHQRSNNGSWILVDSLSIPVEPATISFVENRIVFASSSTNDGIDVYFYTRQNGSWSFREVIQFPNAGEQGQNPSWNGYDTLIFRRDIGIGIYTWNGEEWTEKVIEKTDIGSTGYFGMKTIFIDNDTFVTTDYSPYLSDTGAFIFKRRQNDTWEATHSLYVNTSDSVALLRQFTVNDHDIIFPRLGLENRMHYDGLGLCFDQKPNITCGLQLSSCRDVNVAPSDLYVLRDSCSLVLQPVVFDLHLGELYGNMSFDLHFSRSGIDTSCRATVSCPLPTTPSTNTPPSTNTSPISSNSPLAASKASTLNIFGWNFKAVLTSGVFFYICI